MSRLHKRLIVVFCIGVFLTGIGTGVTFTEFSSLTYGGRQMLGEPDMRTESFDVEYETDGGTCDVICGDAWKMTAIQADAKVPRNTVRFKATYNADLISPKVFWNQEENEVIFSWNWNPNYDEAALMMEAKDLFLQNLKNGRVVSFESPGYLTEVTASVNPASLDDVQIAY